MAWTPLKTDYEDARWNGLRKYIQINNDDGTISLQDKTAYIGQSYQNSILPAADVNRMNETMNELIRRQQEAIDIYENAADGAGAHNSLYRGKNLGSSVTSTQWANIKNGTFKDLFIGDYWRSEAINWRIGAFDYYYNKANRQTNHHILIVPDSIVSGVENKYMNATDTTNGGFSGSAMGRTWLITAREQPARVFGGEHFLTFRTFETNVVSNGRPTGGIWTQRSILPMNELMIFGSHILGASNAGGSPPTVQTLDSTQLPLFAHAPEFITESDLKPYWLRDVVSTASFAAVDHAGMPGYGNASSTTYGIRPYFCIYQP